MLKYVEVKQNRILSLEGNEVIDVRWWGAFGSLLGFISVHAFTFSFLPF